MRKEQVNNEWFYGTVCKVHFLPAAARTVNSRNLSMSATRLDVLTADGRSYQTKVFQKKSMNQIDIN